MNITYGAKVAVGALLAVASIFTGAWAGPIGLIIWSGLTVEALIVHGFTLEVFKCCLLGSMGVAMFVYWAKYNFNFGDPLRGTNG